VEGIGEERDEAEEPEEAGQRPLDRTSAPVSLGLDTQMATGFRERDLHHPTRIPPKQQH